MVIKGSGAGEMDEIPTNGQSERLSADLPFVEVVYNENALANKYLKTAPSSSDDTSAQILYKASKLYAQYGFNGVSMRDIADAVGIKPASLYNHFENKTELFDKVLEQIRILYINYFDRLDEVNSQAKSFKEILDNMFHELINVVDLFTYYGLSLMQTEQFNNEKAAALMNDILLEYSVDKIRYQFDKCINDGWVKPFDTTSVAILIMCAVLVGNNQRVQEDLGRSIAYNVSDTFKSIRDFFIEILVTEE